MRIIMPGIPDKSSLCWQNYFSKLMRSGVKIYLYTPGFVHAKVFISDDSKAVVGTINLDYRSLYNYFECATYMYKVDAIQIFMMIAFKPCESKRVTQETLIVDQPMKNSLDYWSNHRTVDVETKYLQILPSMVY